jgi:hypothetical protein
MSALFAYLLAVGLLLGGGYGALSWLAAPEPVKVVVKAKPKQPPRDEANSEARSFETRTSSLALNDRDHAASANDPPSPARSEARVAPSEQGAEPQSSEPSQTQQSLAAYAEVSPAEARQEVRQPSLAASPVSANNPQPAASTATRPVKRPRARPAGGGHSEKSRLALMTLRTIEFPDGRRVTQLIPYRNGGRLLGFQPDD